MSNTSNNILIRCPHCQKWSRIVLIKPEDLEFEQVWSDGFIYNYSSLNNEKELFLCPNCIHYFWHSDSKVLQRDEDNEEIDQIVEKYSNSIYDAHKLFDKALFHDFYKNRLDFYSNAIQQKVWNSNEQELYLRKVYRWTINDLERFYIENSGFAKWILRRRHKLYFRDTPSVSTSEIRILQKIFREPARQNMVRLLELLMFSDWQTHIEKVDILRSLGDFGLAERFFLKIDESKMNKKVFALYRKKIKSHNKNLFIIYY